MKQTVKTSKHYNGYALPMSQTAQAALWSKTTGGNHVPVQFFIEPNDTRGWKISSLDSDFCGFSIVDHIRTKREAVELCNLINQEGATPYRYTSRLFTVGTFAWAGYPMPTVS